MPVSADKSRVVSREGAMTFLFIGGGLYGGYLLALGVADLWESYQARHQARDEKDAAHSRLIRAR